MEFGRLTQEVEKEAVFCLESVGSTISEWTAELFEQGNYVKGMLADAIADVYLFQLDAEGQPTKTPYDNAGYMDIAPEDKCENVRREICLLLEQMGIYPESSHHEEGPGQNEIDFRYSDPLTAADNTLTFQAVVKTVAQRNGLYADFSPKPLRHQPGNGFHINICLLYTSPSPRD